MFHILKPSGIEYHKKENIPMWFFRQAGQVPPTPQREVEQRIEPMVEQVVEPMIEPVVAGMNEDFMELMDKKGWWIDETVIT